MNRSPQQLSLPLFESDADDHKQQRPSRPPTRPAEASAQPGLSTAAPLLTSSEAAALLHGFGAHPEAVVAEASGQTHVQDEGIGDVARKRPSATDLLAKPDALLTRSDLRELGLERRAVDAVLRALPVVALPGYSRPLVRVEDYRKLVERNTFRDDRVRPGRHAA